MMDQASIIRDLLDWLEDHLDNPLSLDHVATKAGYSKWHLQRMFKDVTKQPIGSYIRARRLSKAAVALRLTSRPILDIALQYRFDSQQTFTRAFKKQFSRTPAQYRRIPEWDSTGMCPPIRLNGRLLPEAQFITMTDKALVGITQNYTCSLDDLSACRSQMRMHFWTDYLQHARKLPSTLYAMNDIRPNKEQEDEQEIFYTMALLPDDVPPGVTGGTVILPAGEYVQFSFKGHPDDVQNFIITLYSTCLPLLRLVRQPGQDIEIYDLKGHQDIEKMVQSIHFRYLIPIKS